MNKRTLSAPQQRWLAANSYRSQFLTSIVVQYGERGWISEAQYQALAKWAAKDPSVQW
jgi:hypothetical protein